MGPCPGMVAWVAGGLEAGPMEEAKLGGDVPDIGKWVAASVACDGGGASDVGAGGDSLICDETHR